MNLVSIRHLSNQAARKAARAKKMPYTPWGVDEIRDDMPPFPFPNIGSYRPKGWKLVDQLFCDSSGFGSPGEPALTIGQLQAKLVEHIADGHSYGYAIVEEGQFQLYIGVFEKQTAKAEHGRQGRSRNSAIWS